MNLKKIVSAGAIAGTLGLSAIGLAGTANAAPAIQSGPGLAQHGGYGGGGGWHGGGGGWHGGGPGWRGGPGFYGGGPGWGGGGPGWGGPVGCPLLPRPGILIPCI